AAMATFEEQTACVVEALFSDLLGEDESECRSLETDSGEPMRSAVEYPTTFDPTVIASRLRQMGDRCNMDFERVSSEALAEVFKGKPFQPHSQRLQVEKFEAAVDSLSRRWRDQNPELVYESAFLSVAVKLVMHIAKKVPALVRPTLLIEVINGNPQVRNYIEAQGGWVRMQR
ncbi:B2L15 protein, partial [Glaucidium brasilianum]|nr:B2L15 protein [Glaucidium brasilianum]